MVTASGSARTLLIEDDDADALLVAERLNRFAPGEFSVDRVCDLHSGVEKLASGSYSAAIVDLHLPDSSGAKAWRDLQSNVRGTPVIVLTGTPDELLEDMAVYEGVQDFLLKSETTGPGLVRALKHAKSREARMVNVRKQHLELLATSARIRNLMVSSAEGLVVIDRGGAVIFVNGQGARWSGLPVEGSIGARFPLPLPSKGIGHCDVAVDELGDSTQAGVRRVRVARLEIRAVPSNWAGKPVTVVTMRDVTAQSAETRRLSLLTDLDRAIAAQAGDASAVCETVADLLPRLVPYQRLEIAVSQNPGLPSSAIVRRGDIEPFNRHRSPGVGTSGFECSVALGDRRFPRGWLKVGSARSDVLGPEAVAVLEHIGVMITACLGLLGPRPGTSR